MDLLTKFKNKAKKAAEIVEFEVKLIPGVTEDEDVYKAFNEELSINCYGLTKDLAIDSAKKEAEAMLFEEPTLADSILKSAKK